MRKPGSPGGLPHRFTSMLLNGGGAWSLPEQCFEIASSMHHAKNKNVLTFDTVDDDVLTRGDAARPGAEIFIAASSNIGEGGQEKETASDCVNHAGGDIHAAAFFGDV